MNASSTSDGAGVADQHVSQTSVWDRGWTGTQGGEPSVEVGGQVSGPVRHGGFRPLDAEHGPRIKALTVAAPQGLRRVGSSWRPRDLALGRARR